MSRDDALVAFLRGVNLGKRTAKKEQLVRAVESIGATDAWTFLASGNVVLSGGTAPADLDELERSLEAAFAQELGYEVDVFVRTERQLAALARRVPFPDLDLSTGTLQVGFLHRPLPRTDRAAVLGLSSGVDHLGVRGREIWWHTAGGVSESPLFSGPALGRAIDRPVTMRNVNTVRRLAAKLVA